MTITPTDPGALNSGRIELEITINASPDDVWEAFINDTTQWWPVDFRAVDAASTVTLEPVAGGRLFEELKDASVLWASVLSVDPAKSLNLIGHIVPPYGGPCISYPQFTFEDIGNNTTRMKLTDTVMGILDPSKLGAAADGWLAIFEGGLKVHVEAKQTA